MNQTGFINSAKKVAVLQDLAQLMELHREEPFHNPRHPEHVATDALAILEIFRKYLGSDLVSSLDDLVVEIAAAGHDVILDHTVLDKPEDSSLWNYRQRVRHRGFGGLMPENVKKLPEVYSLNGNKIGNEELSWLITFALITRYDPDRTLFTDEILDKIKNAIAATYPDPAPVAISQDFTQIRTSDGLVDLMTCLDKDNSGQPTVMMFNQPFLKPDSDVTTLAVAFGDLMYAGCCNSETFRMRGNEEFRELRDVLRMEVSDGIFHLSPDRKAEIVRDALAWIKSQVGFLLGQKIRFFSTIYNFHEIDKCRSNQRRWLTVDLINRYSRFDGNIIDAKERYDKASVLYQPITTAEFWHRFPASNQLFIDLLIEMGFEHSDVSW